MTPFPRLWIAAGAVAHESRFGPPPPSPSDGPQPAHLLILCVLLLGLAALAFVLFRRWRKSHPATARTELASATPSRGEAAGRALRAGASATGRGLRALLHFVSILIAFILSVLLVVVAALVLVLFNVERTVFDPDTVKRALVEQGFYEQFGALIAEQFEVQAAYIQKHAGVDVENMSASLELEACLREALGDEAFAAIAGFEREGSDEEFALMRPCFERFGQVAGEGEEGEAGGPPIAFERLTSDDWGAIFAILLPPEVLRPQLEGTIDSIFALVDPDAPPGDITMSLVPLREHLRGGAAVEAFMYVVRAQPPCTPEQLAELDAGPIHDLPPCRPPDAALAAMAEGGGEVLADVLADMPEQAELTELFIGPDRPTEPPPEGGGPLGRTQDPLEALRLIRPFLRLSPLLPIVVLLLIALFGVRSWRGLLLWWGMPGFVVGLIVSVAAAAVLPAMNWAIAAFVMKEVPASFAPSLVELGLDVARSVVRAVVAPIQVQAGALLVVCLGLMIASFFVRPRRAPVPAVP